MYRTIISTATQISGLFVVAMLAACGPGGGAGQSNGSQVVVTPDYVDLRPQQTALRNQGSRRTCITFAAVAALEAAYKEAGYGDLDLSEEFVNHVGKMFWLHPNWNNGDPDQLIDKGANYTENQVGAFGGGSGPFYITLMANGLAIPKDEAMPYRSTDRSLISYCAACDDYTNPYWKVQRNANDFNLDPEILPFAAITQDVYYSVESYRDIADPKDPAQIEAALRDRNEVAWDFKVKGVRGRDIWVPADDATVRADAHSMLIVGYDARNPDNKFFIVKNSWGTDDPATGSDGWTRISYDYVRAYGIRAAYIERIRPPAPKPEYAFLGKWNMSFDGHKGSLHIYHIPGLAEPVFRDLGLEGETDRRLGVFFDPAGQAFRVNGSIIGNKITFYFDNTTPNLKWDALQGRIFNYLLFKGDDRFPRNWGTGSINREMAGLHTDPNGTRWAGYAAKDGLYSGPQWLLPHRPAITSRPLDVDSYRGRWYVNFNAISGYLQLDAIDDNAPGRGSGERALRGTFVPDYSDTITTYAYAYVSVADPALVRFQTGISYYNDLYGRLLSHDNGIVAGYAGAFEHGFVAVQLSAPPSIRITAPVDGFSGYATSRDNAGRYFLPINLSAIATDYRGEPLGNQVVWTDSINGGPPQTIGYGANLTGIPLYASPALGGAWVHRITATTRDWDGVVHSQTIIVTVMTFG